MKRAHRRSRTVGVSCRVSACPPGGGAIEHAPARLARAQQHARAQQAGPCGARDGEHRTQARDSRSTEEEEEAVPIIGSRMLRRLPACHPPPPTARQCRGRRRRQGRMRAAPFRAETPACLPAPLLLHSCLATAHPSARRPPGASDHSASACHPLPHRARAGEGGPRGRRVGGGECARRSSLATSQPCYCRPP